MKDELKTWRILNRCGVTASRTGSLAISQREMRRIAGGIPFPSSGIGGYAGKRAEYRAARWKTKKGAPGSREVRLPNCTRLKKREIAARTFSKPEIASRARRNAQQSPQYLSDGVCGTGREYAVLHGLYGSVRLGGNIMQP